MHYSTKSVQGQIFLTTFSTNIKTNLSMTSLEWDKLASWASCCLTLAAIFAYQASMRPGSEYLSPGQTPLALMWYETASIMLCLD